MKQRLLLIIALSTIIFAIALSQLTSCSGGVIPQLTESNGSTKLLNDGNVFRFIDEEMGVVCWMYIARGGITCLPFDQVKPKLRPGG